MKENEALYMEIADEIISKIRNGEYTVGMKLPSERSLTEMYNVSRNVVRESLKVLREKGLIMIKSGKGAYVCELSEDELKRKFEETVDFSDVKQDEIIDAREAIELAIAKKVIKNITDEQQKLLVSCYQELEDALEDRHAYSQADARFHLLLATCSGNSLLKVMMSVLNDITNREEYLFGSKSIGIREQAQEEHYTMVKAVQEKDLKSLEQAIIRHISCMREVLKNSNMNYEDVTA